MASNNLRELQNRVEAYIEKSKEKGRILKERTDQLTTTLNKAVGELSAVSGEYRELLDDQTDLLQSIHTELLRCKGRNDAEVDTGEVTVLPKQASEDSDSLNAAKSQSKRPDSEKLQMQNTDSSSLHVRRVIYSAKRKRSTSELVSSASNSSPLLPAKHLMHDGQGTPHVTEDVQAQAIIGDYHDGHSRKQFKYPYQLANGPNNELIISDRDQHQLVVYDETLKSSYVHDFAVGEGSYCVPTGLAVDIVNFCLFVADRDNNIIQQFRINYPKPGRFPCRFEHMNKYGDGKGSDEGQLNCPCGLAVSKKGLGLFVCDLQNNRIQRFCGKKVLTFGKRGRGCGEFNEPHFITFNSNEDKLFVSDHGNNRIQVFTPQGGFIDIIEDPTDAPTWAQLRYPRGIYCTHDGRLLVSSTHTNCILEFKEDGTYLSTIEGICQPGGIILHHNGDVIVTSTSTDMKTLIVLKLQVIAK